MAQSEVFRAAFKFTNLGIDLVTSDMAEEDALKRARGGEGASLLWTIGHLMLYRCGALQKLGVDRPMEYEEYNGSAGDIETYPTLAEIKPKWDALAEELDAALKQATDEQLHGPAQGLYGGERLFSSLIFVMGHESCHLGYLGNLRLELGYRPTAVLAVEAMRKASE